MAQYKLKRKFTIAYLLSILPFLIFVFFLFDQWMDFRRQTILIKNYQIAKTMTTTVRQLFDNTLATGNLLARDPAVRSLSKTNAAPLLYRTLEQYPAFTDVVLIDRFGTVIVDPIKPENENKFAALGDKPFFKELQADKTPQVGNLADSPDRSNNPLIYLASPIINQEATISGAVVFTLSANTLRSYLELPQSKDNLTWIALLDKNKELIFATQYHREDIKDLTPPVSGYNFKDDPVFKNLLAANRDGSFDGYKSSFMPIASSGVITTLSPYNWTILIASPIESQIAPISRLQNTFIILSLLSIIYAILIITYFIRRFLSFI